MHSDLERLERRLSRERRSQAGLLLSLAVFGPAAMDALTLNQGVSAWRVALDLLLCAVSFVFGYACARAAAAERARVQHLLRTMHAPRPRIDGPRLAIVR
jgi:uncharacterized membrane protein YqaE (UPF0057 family)